LLNSPMQRVEPNLTLTGPNHNVPIPVITMSVETLLQANTTETAAIYYRGYVESIGHLSPHQLQ